jgi:hypothetical protein
MGAEALLLLGLDRHELPIRAAFRQIITQGAVIDP